MRSLALALVLLTLPAAVHAQAAQERQTGFMVHQWQICRDLTEYNRINDQITPILEELRSEGMIRAWYDIRHAWGDEWNVGLVTTFDSHQAWLNFWNEFLRRVNERIPGLFARFSEVCTLHKDNLYNVRDSRTGGGERL